MHILELDNEKITRCKNELLREYYKDSIVEKAVDIADFNEAAHSNLNFLKSGRWLYIPKEWFTDPSIYPDLVFKDVGRGIALGEKKHIVDKILANNGVMRIYLETITIDNIKEAFMNLASKMHQSNITQYILFAPIEYFVTLYIDWVKDNSLRVVPGTTKLIVNNTFQIDPIWSNKYIDFKEFIILEKSLCRWIAKPNIRNRLEVDIVESEQPDKIELKAQTIFNFTIINPELISVLSPTKLALNLK